MADNRMYLVFMPTKEAVYLGKRMTFGWYGTNDKLGEHVRELFALSELASHHGNQDDFQIVFEDQEQFNQLNVLNLNKADK